MIYILSTKNELSFSNIWQGHYDIITEVLDELSLRWVFWDFSRAQSKLEFLPTDTVINIGNHQYCGNLLESVGQKLKECQFIGFIDDYKAPLPTQFRKYIKGILITNIKDPPLHLKSFSWVEKWFYVDLNRASYNPLSLKPVGKDFIYWGSYRKEREDYFDKYFGGTYYKVCVSASKRAHNKFSEIYNYRGFDKLKIPEDLQKFGFTIYFFGPKRPNQSPANRFYEAISAGLPIFFDKNCIKDFDNINDIRPWMIDGPEDIQKFNLKNVQYRQFIELRKPYRELLKFKLTDIFGSLLCK
jgi:hypothetical protein